MDWPKHPDGTPKKMGEMNREERGKIWDYSFLKTKEHFENPAVKAHIEKVLNNFDKEVIN